MIMITIYVNFRQCLVYSHIASLVQIMTYTTTVFNRNCDLFKFFAFVFAEVI